VSTSDPERVRSSKNRLYSCSWRQMEVTAGFETPFRCCELNIGPAVSTSDLERVRRIKNRLCSCSWQQVEVTADFGTPFRCCEPTLILQVSTSNLERVRRIKNRLVRLTTRVQTLREMLEKLMDDDSDMHAMHLTARAYDQLERQVGLLSGTRRWHD
jgi:hypothetical protein